MERRKDYYVVLGVQRNASLTAIRRAYRRLARKYQPEGGSSSQELFREVQKAYETLSDAERRRRYDDSLQENEHEGLAPFTRSFVGSPAAGDLRRPMSPGTLSGEILLTSGEAAAGGSLPLDVPVLTTCPACEGTGGATFDCDRCWGEGKIQRRLPVPVRVPPGVRDGEVFQVVVDEPGVQSIFFTVHIRPFS